MLTQRALANRLRAARVNAGLSQETVANELGVPRPTISQIEAGVRSVSSLELAKLARLYNRPVESLLSEGPEGNHEEDSLTILLRASELRAEDREVIEEFEAICRNFSNLEALLGLGQELVLPDYSTFDEPRNKLDAIRQGEQVAAEERRRLGIGDDPIRNVFNLLESQGIRLFVRRLEESGVSGLFLYDDQIGPCILINGAEHRNRLAFNCAHEYAHVLLDRRLRARVSTASRQLGEQDRNTELLEVRANSFAAALLLPAIGIERFLWDRGMTRRTRQNIDVVDILYLHRAFGVSYQAALYRLQNLGWLTRSDREALAEHQPDVLAQALDLPDEHEVDPVNTAVGPYPLRYISLAFEAYRQAKITLEKLAELLKKSVPETKELIGNLGLRTKSRPL